MKNKMIPVIKILIIVSCVLIISVLAAIDTKDRNMDETYYMYATVEGQRINVYKHEGKFYLFLPGFADKKDIELSREAKKQDINVMKSANIATVFISTSSGSIDKILEDKEYKERGKICIYDENGKLDTSLGLEYLKGRGNYSWNNWDKKPFKLKLSKNASVLGLGMGKDYALIANASDATLIRNEIARQLEIEAGIPFAAKGRFADVYINGEYMGNYYLCASIEVGKDRIDISNIDDEQSKVYGRLNSEAFDVHETPELKGWNLPETTEDITGGYLVEREFEDRYRYEYGNINNGFITDAREHFVVMSPKYCTVSEIWYISDFFQKAEDEIMGNSEEYEYVDIDSFANRYMIEEVVKNYDGGVSSAFYFKDSDSVDGRLVAGPGWDFDMSLGNYLDWMEYYDQDATGITKLYNSYHSSIYYKTLLNKKGFNEMVREHFRESAVPYMNSLVESGIDEYEQLLSASAAMDALKWSEMYNEKGYTTGDKNEYEGLKKFIEDRMAFLSKEWLE